MKREIIITEDGSNTIFLTDINEHYHSVHGAIAESMHVFIHTGLQQKMTKQNNLNILEIGMGTGLNVILTFQNAKNANIKYFAVEPNMLNKNEIEQLKYEEILKVSDKILFSIHSVQTNSVIILRNNFSFSLLKNKLQNLEFENNFFDLVYFDAFSPNTQPEMWTQEILKKIYKAMKPNAILVTYVAKGEVRRNMKTIGFEIEKLEGFAKKREMTRATKKI